MPEKKISEYDLDLKNPENNPWGVFPILTRDAEVEGKLMSFITFIQVVGDKRAEKPSVQITAGGDLKVSEEVSTAFFVGKEINHHYSPLLYHNNRLCLTCYYAQKRSSFCTR